MTGTLHGGRLIRPSAANYTETINALPIGAVTAWMGNDIPADFLGFRDVSYPVSRMAYPEFVEAVWCGQAYNAEADFFYRTADEAGTIRSETGDWLWMPIGDLYFMRGRDASGSVHPYEYQDWAIENIAGSTNITLDGVDNLPLLNAASGVFANDIGDVRARPTDFASGIAQPSGLSFDASRVVKTDTETRPMNFPVKWIIRAANSRASESGIDVVALKTKVDGLESLIESVTDGTGLPTASYFWWGGREDAIPPYAMNLSKPGQQTILVSRYEGFVNKVWVGADANDTAAYYYRCDSVDGSGRNPQGQYLAMPIADDRFVRSVGMSFSMANQYLEDAIRNIEGTFSSIVENRIFDTNGVFYNAQQKSWYYSTAGATQNKSLGFDASRVVPTADENRPKSFSAILCVKLFDGVSNPDMLNIQELIEAANNNSVPLGTIMESGGTEADPGFIKCIDTVQFYPIATALDLFNKVWAGDELNDTVEYFFRCSSDGTRIPDGTYFAIPSDLQIRKSGNPTTIIYPNGGTAEEPANMTVSQRLTFSNPYPGHYLYCEAQTFVNNVWGTCSVVYSSPNASGLLAGLVEDTIVLQTANGNLGSPPLLSCGTWGGTSGAGTSVPCRIIVTRLGKIDAPPTFYQIKAWGAVVNQGLADMSKIQAQIAGQNHHLVTSTIIYPNGGTAENPANVTANQRIIMDNPYPGYYVQCEAQIFLDGKWGTTGFYGVSTAAYGVDAKQLLPDETIIVQTGFTGLISSSSFTGGSLPYSGNNTAAHPCRVIVHRQGKIR